MHRFSLPLTLALAITITAIPARAAEEADPAQALQGRQVWTTDDMEDLRARGLISIVGAETVTIPSAAVAAAASPVTPYSSRTEDPAWYADQAAELQAQLSARRAALLLAQQNLAQARSIRQTTGGINLAEANPGITPEEGIAALLARLSEVQTRFDELADLARRNNIPPSVLRPVVV